MKQRDIFIDALQIDDGAQRIAFLEEACGDDIALRQCVEELLTEHQRNASFFLDAPPPGLGAITAMAAITEEPGTQIGPYKLLEQIGEGGMGTVYMAQQTEPIRRRVALKIIKAGMNTRQVVARFAAEQQALAMMEHPHIAQVHDAGVTESGRPYFVMELVRGLPITEYCDEHQLNTRQRLELFAAVCWAVQHAHQKGVIHRDLKPNNVLVELHDVRPVPKIIDFGVAKAVDRELTEKTLFTNFAQMIGTPLYMSPEQAELSGLDVDTRSDIYSLGVLLYELITGATPFDAQRLREAGHDEMRRIIREEDPPNPSTRLSTMAASDSSTVAERRRTDARRLKSTVRGEVDWIVMKAMEKDRARRYESSSGLAADVERHLAGDPVEACPPSRIYSLGKFIRRNKGWLSTATAVLLTVLVGLTVSTILIARDRDAAEVSAHREKVAADRAERQFHAARDAVDRMLTTAASELADLPHSTAIRRKLLEDALEFYEGFLEQKSDDPVIRHETALAYRQVGRIRRHLGDRGGALSACRESIRLLEGLVKEFPKEATYQADLAESTGLSGFVNHLLDRDENIRASRRSLQLLQQLAAEHPAHPEYHRMVATAHTDLGNALQVAGRTDEAQRHLRQALAEWDHLHRDHPELPRDTAGVLHSRHWLGASLVEVGQLDEAEGHLCEVHAGRLETLQDDSTSRLSRYRLAHIVQWLGILRNRQGRIEEEEALFRQAIELLDALVEDFPGSNDYRERMAGMLDGLGRLLMAAGMEGETEQLLRRAIEHRERLVATDPLNHRFIRALGQSYSALGLQLYRADGRSEEAAQAFRRAFEACETYLASHPEAPASATGRIIIIELADFLSLCPVAQFRNPDRAAELLNPLLQHSAEDDNLWGALGMAHYAAGEWEQAIAAYEKADTLAGNSKAWNLFPMAMCQWQLGHHDEAARTYDEAISHFAQHRNQHYALTFLRSEAVELLGRESSDERRPAEDETQQ